MVAFIVLVITILLTFLFGDVISHPYQSSGADAKSHPEQSPYVVGGADVFCADLADGTKNVLIVDVANLYGDSASTAKKSAFISNQGRLFEEYLDVMGKVYDSILPGHLANPHAQIHFVMKNHKVGGADGAPKIAEKTWEALRGFVKGHPLALISIVEDYKTYDMAKWKDPKNHYLRGGDDYVCFLLTQEYKKGYKLACIMSNDKYKDFPKLHLIPIFTVRRISTDKLDGEAVKVDPSKHRLGQFVDYRRVPIDYTFSFADYIKKNRL